MSFSSDDRLFTYETVGSGVYLWKESLAGYTLQKVLPNSDGFISPLLSPNGESIIIPSGISKFQLWRTEDPNPSTPDVPKPVGQTSVILEFSPGETLTAVARLRGNTATVLDLRSGDPRLIIDTGMKILGLRAAESTIVVVSMGKVAAWNLPAEGYALNTRANNNDSIWATMFDCAAQLDYISISPNFNYLAIARVPSGEDIYLNIYDTSTGKCLTGTRRGHSGRTRSLVRNPG